MSTPADSRDLRSQTSSGKDGMRAQVKRRAQAVSPFQLHARVADEETPRRQAELFYLQKQIQTQTPMVIVLKGGEKIQGAIEWYDRYTLKVRGRSKTLVYKSAIKYMYKAIEAGE